MRKFLFYNISRQRAGYTMIEMLLYIAIFSLIIGSVLSIASSISTQRIQNQITQEVDYQGQTILSSISQNLRNSSVVNLPTAGNVSTSLSYNTSVVANNPSIYDTVIDQNVNRLRLKNGSNAPEYITNSRVSISNLTFTNRAITGGRDSIDVGFTLTYYNPSGKVQLQYQKNFFGVTTLR